MTYTVLIPMRSIASIVLLTIGLIALKYAVSSILAVLRGLAAPTRLFLFFITSVGATYFFHRAGSDAEVDGEYRFEDELLYHTAQCCRGLGLAEVPGQHRTSCLRRSLHRVVRRACQQSRRLLPAICHSFIDQRTCNDEISKFFALIPTSVGRYHLNGTRATQLALDIC
ncbi:hypothetical protein DFH09DRAFT_1081892 [Mycena vulgaris]|nr:hypothetical protein DFH09DRAFT_1081892 [Mycena vulgaris]